MRMILGLLVAAFAAVGCAPDRYYDPYGAQAARHKPVQQDNSAGK
jgi:hypothetical protein